MGHSGSGKEGEVGDVAISSNGGIWPVDCDPLGGHSGDDGEENNWDASAEKSPVGRTVDGCDGAAGSPVSQDGRAGGCDEGFDDSASVRSDCLSIIVSSKSDDVAGCCCCPFMLAIFPVSCHHSLAFCTSSNGNDGPVGPAASGEDGCCRCRGMGSCCIGLVCTGGIGPSSSAINPNGVSSYSSVVSGLDEFSAAATPAFPCPFAYFVRYCSA